MGTRHSHCSYCGHAFLDGAAWPRTCDGCGSTSYLNPLPVAIALVPVGDGLLAVRRELGHGRGSLALPGGFIEVGESWQVAAAREVREEAGVEIDADGIVDFRVLSAPDGTVLIFGLAQAVDGELSPFEPNEEVSERVVLEGPCELAFPLHTRVCEEYFARRRPLAGETRRLPRP